MVICTSSSNVSEISCTQAPPVITCGFIYIHIHATHIPSHMLYHNAFYILSHLAYHTCSLLRYVAAKFGARYCSHCITLGCHICLKSLPCYAALILHKKYICHLWSMLKCMGFLESQNACL